MANQFAHMVYFTLKQDSAAARQALVSACQEFLSNHPGTTHFCVGTLADKTRDVNDRDFHVSLSIVFDSEASQDAYQTAERHQQFIDQQKANWAKVRVFDSVVSEL